MNRIRSAALAATCVLSLALIGGRPAAAQSVAILEPGEEPGVLFAGAGIFDFTEEAEDTTTGMLQVEVVPGYNLIRVGDYFALHPYAGVWATFEGGVFGWGGFQAVVPIGGVIEARPFFGIGGHHDGGGKDLTGTWLFHSGIMLDIKFEGGWRLGASFSHQSHADILSDGRNPGADSVLVSFGVPLDRLF